MTDLGRTPGYQGEGFRMLCRFILHTKAGWGFRSFLLLSGLHLPSGSASAEGRVLNLSFWTEASSRVALGGLWEFYEDRWLKPEDYDYPSDTYADVDVAWQNFRSMSNGERLRERPRASYAMQFKGLRPSPEGYVLRLVTEGEGAQLKIFPKYAPERKIETSAFASDTLLSSKNQGSKDRLQLFFSPKSLDDIWIVIINRYQNQTFHVPTLERL